MKGIELVQMEGPALFKGEIITKWWKYIDKTKNLFLHNHWANFNQTWHNASFGYEDSSLLKWRASRFSHGRLLRNSKNTLLKFKNLLQNHWANFNQTWHNAFLGEGDSSLFSSNEGTHIFPRGDNEVAKIHWWHLKIFFHRSTGTISTKFAIKHP
mgnify:CR=1 FL=1